MGKIKKWTFGTAQCRLIGVLVGIFYRKIPHLSLLTFCFGIGVLLSVVPLITNYLVPDLNIDLPYQLMLFSNLGGFYLPFVFDVVLSATSANYRGTACGIIDLIIALASIIGVSIVVFFNPGETLILLMTIILFIPFGNEIFDKQKFHLMA